MNKLAPDQIAQALPKVPQWKQHGEAIQRRFELNDFAAAMKFVNRVAALAEEENHHPDIEIRWNVVTLSLSTHDAGGLTQNDFDLAQAIDRLQ